MREIGKLWCIVTYVIIMILKERERVREITK